MYNSKSKLISFRLFKTIPDIFIDKIKLCNTSFLDKQCLHLERAIELCKDTEFLEEYDKNLDKSLEKRKEIFRSWEELYNLNAYV